MPRYVVETDLIIHTRIKVLVEAEMMETAVDAATKHMPKLADPGSQAGWKAAIELELRTMKPIQVIGSVRAQLFEKGGGADKVRLAKN